MRIPKVIYACVRPDASQERLPAALSALAVALLVVSFAPAGAQAAEQSVALEQEREPAQAIGWDSVSAWMRKRFSASEIDALSPGDINMESHDCNCSDRPEPHFPYRVVLFRTPKGDLVARADGHEQVATITPLAVRNGDRYCKLDPDEPCYGSFANVCEFTDFRYGPVLQPFFPTCKE